MGANGAKTAAVDNKVRLIEDHRHRPILVPGDDPRIDIRIAGNHLPDRLFRGRTVVAPVSLIAYLCSALAVKPGESAIDRLHFIESIHDKWGDLVPGEL